MSLGSPRITDFGCFSNGTDDTVTLSWSLAMNESSAPVDHYTLNITSSPPDPTLANIYQTDGTVFKINLTNGVTYHVEITADNCIAPTITNYRVEGT